MIEQPSFAEYIGNVASGMDGLSGPLSAVSAQPENAIVSARNTSWAERTSPSNVQRSR